MSRSLFFRCSPLLLAALPLACSEPSYRSGLGPPPAEPAAAAGLVYGEWRIRVKPDKGSEYNQLIETKGLPLFRAAGGRMVGWWTTLIGDLYEHVTIWEYDGLPAFEKAVAFLGKSEPFAEFVRLRDPLLAGEESRFLAPAGPGEAPERPQRSRWAIHEVHRVPLARQEEYLKFMTEMLPVLKKHGFRVAGPWRAVVGNWNEITLLFAYESLQERDDLIARFSIDPAGKLYRERLSKLADGIRTRLLTPAPFVK